MRFGDTPTRVLLAVVSQDRPTVRSVALQVGKCPSYTLSVLRSLRAAGLVQWDEDKQGTLRPMVAGVRTSVRYNDPQHTSGAGAALTARPLGSDLLRRSEHGER